DGREDSAAGDCRYGDRSGKQSSLSSPAPALDPLRIKLPMKNGITAARILGLGLVAALIVINTSTPYGPAAHAQDQDDDVIRVSTELVVVNVTVIDKNGKFVSGLKPNEFRLFEDGAEQKVLTFTAEKTPFAAAILLDTSGSMESRLTLGRSAALRFLDGLRESDVAAVYHFDVKVVQLQEFSPGRDLPDRAYGLKTKMLTSLNDAVLRAADDLGQREEKRRAIVVLSDGGENYSSASSDKALDHALKAGATIYAVNMGPDGPGRDIAAAGILKNFA